MHKLTYKHKERSRDENPPHYERGTFMSSVCRRRCTLSDRIQRDQGLFTVSPSSSSSFSSTVTRTALLTNATGIIPIFYITSTTQNPCITPIICNTDNTNNSIKLLFNKK